MTFKDYCREQQAPLKQTVMPTTMLGKIREVSFLDCIGHKHMISNKKDSEIEMSPCVRQRAEMADCLLIYHENLE